MYRSISCIKVSDNKITNNINYTNSIFTMKRLFSYLMIFACLLGTAVVTSCSSDDDKEEKLPNLPFLSDAAIYQLKDNKDDISYIELTTAGNYIIQYNSMAPTSSIAMKNFECSTFTKNSDDTYLLAGKNTNLKIESAGTEYKITLGDYTYTATKVGSKAVFSGSDQICRSWKVKKAYAKINSPVVKQPVEVSASNYEGLLKSIDDKGYSLPYFVEIDYISFSNTYKYDNQLSYVGKTNNSIVRGVWQWNNSKINFDDSPEKIDVAFDGTTMKFYHKMVDGTTTIEWGYELYATPLKIK